MTHWTPVAEASPEPFKDVLIAVVDLLDAFVGLGFRDDRGCWWWEDNKLMPEISMVTHWQPLPELPPELQLKEAL